MCLAVTCYLHFGYNDRDRLRTTAPVSEQLTGIVYVLLRQSVSSGPGGTGGVSTVRNIVKGGKKKDTPVSTARTRTRNLRSRVQRSTTELSPLPIRLMVVVHTEVIKKIVWLAYMFFAVKQKTSGSRHKIHITVYAGMFITQSPEYHLFAKFNCQFMIIASTRKSVQDSILLSHHKS